jgi:hypothetical protein
MNEIDILKRNSTYILEEKLLNTSISVYDFLLFLLFEKNITNYAYVQCVKVEGEKKREREISRGRIYEGITGVCLPEC